MSSMLSDRELIEGLGGPAKVAVLLGYDNKPGGVQRVHNWLARGIPAKVKLEHPELFQQQQQRVRQPAAALAGQA